MAYLILFSQSLMKLKSLLYITNHIWFLFCETPTYNFHYLYTLLSILFICIFLKILDINHCQLYVLQTSSSF